MASVTSLDQDMRKLRLSRYTASTANEARAWIEDVLGRSLASGDLLEALKDGVALCELANIITPGLKYKKSAMPFIQMENISHFLRACEMPPLNLPAHDRFLTVDLYESKDPAQVLQCLGAFSRQAHLANPSKFPTTLGPKKSGIISPSTTGSKSSSSWQQTRAMSPSVTGGSAGSQTSTTRSPAPVSSWSTRADQNATAPAWNPVMYGYMGGADQGKQGISFGARRQITSASPTVPSLADKERRRKEKEAEQEKMRSEEQELRRQAEEQEQEQEQAERDAESKRWEAETQRQRDEERARLAQQKQEWEIQERRWKEEEEKSQQDKSITLQSSVKKPPEKPRVPSSSILRGQTLSQYQQEQAAQTETPEQTRVRELEKQLAEARERERQYQAEREERLRAAEEHVIPGVESSSTDRPNTANSDLSWTGDERDFLKQRQSSQNNTPSKLSKSTTAAEVPQTEPEVIRGQVEPVKAAETEPLRAHSEIGQAVRPSQTLHQATNSPRTTPSSTFRSPFARPANRTETYLSSSPAPTKIAPRVSSTAETGDTANEQSQLRDQRIASQQKTQAGAWASKSLLDREIERERERQKEWEDNQAALKNLTRDTTQGSGPGQTWDVNTYGFTAGDSQNKGSSAGSGISMGGRRQIIGPRPQP